MAKETLMHVHFSKQEALTDKKEILRLQLSAIKILRKLKAYHELRILELKTKVKINTHFNKINKNILKFQKIMPEVEVPKKFKKKSEKNIEKSKQKPEKKVYKDKLEKELEEIQNQLKKIDQKF